ncbi:hypothetical protein MY04_4368 [Flammeovirga sp. MY04]|uniref:hypothetical protein n=1 Tax=Flammeovirga sp. MY04 TaxID=1191459 RepID=UPI0008063A75|nr:hypothetical protein [Flammeovirga sp. MY04]ANQ51706.1 hypothetical protein MY04_4368 [Flammeovirga sp. MY04]
MNLSSKLGGLALIVVGLLNIFRIFPILFTEGVTLDQIPPHTLEDTIFIAQTNAYLVSHIMALLATPLFIFGITLFNNNNLNIKRDTTKYIGLFALIGLTIGQLFYSLGLIIDGFTLPTIINDFVQNKENDSMKAVIMGVHQIAMGFAGIGFFTLLLSTGIFGFVLYRIKWNRFISASMIFLGFSATIGYFIGFLDPMIGGNFEFTYGALTFMYLLYLSMGVYQMKRDNQEKVV